MTRTILAVTILSAAFSLADVRQNSEVNMIERWGIFEVTLNGPDTGNPFTEVELTAEFKQEGRTFEPQGFYDGDGVYKIRFMPDEVGEWTYTTKSNRTHRNFTFGQDGNRFTVRIRTPRTGGNATGGEFSFSKIEAGKPTHVVVSYFDGNVYCYIDGELVYVSNGIQGDFSNWERYPLLFGDEASGGRNWEGKLSRVAVYSRFVGVEEATHKFKLIQGE